MAKSSDAINLGQNCDICWDDDGRETPAYTLIAGVPVCVNHSKIAVQLRKPKEGKEMAATAFEEIVEPPITACKKGVDRKGIRKSALVAANGIRTAKDFANLMTAMMDDLLNNAVDVGTAVAVCSAGDRLLRVAEMQLRYQPRNGKPLQLGAPQEQDERKPPASF